jgi:para-nitrobenzyl esterase
MRKSEDCLKLDVYVPPAAKVAKHGKPLAVLFWMYGGAFSLGASRFYENYNAKFLVDNFDMVVVSANYRIGQLGFLAVSGKGGRIRGNAGIQDQIAALEWVKRNIRHFGGDPDNVTIAGGSAGATSVSIHVTSASTKPSLFKRAIMQSVPFGIYMRSVKEAESVGYQFAKNVSCVANSRVDIACLKALPLSKIAAASKHFTTDGAGIKPVTDQFWAWPHIDGAIIKENPLHAFLKGHYKKVPIIMGTTRDETGLFTFTSTIPILSDLLGKRKMFEPENMKKLMQSYFGKQAAKVAKYYPVRATATENEEMYVRLSTDMLFVCPSLRVADAIASTTPVHYYQLTKTTKSFKLLGDCGGKKICHGAEIPFVWRGPVFSMTADEKKLSDQMLSHRISFMYGQSLQGWAPFKQGILQYGNEVVMTKPTDDVKRCQLWNKDLGYLW